jgi:hypothetical protein
MRLLKESVLQIWKARKAVAIHMRRQALGAKPSERLRGPKRNANLG